MIALLASAPALPLGKSGKFVAGAYIVVFVIVIAYVAIMAIRAQRTERELDQLRRDVEAAREGAGRPAEPDRAAQTDPPAQADRAAHTGDGDPERSGSLL